MARHSLKLPLHAASLALLRRSWKRMTVRTGGQAGARSDRIWQPVVTAGVEAAAELGELPRPLSKWTPSREWLEQSIDEVWPIQLPLSGQDPAQSLPRVLGASEPFDRDVSPGQAIREPHREGHPSHPSRMQRELERCNEWEERLIDRIVERTRRCNRNNRTRTQAYWDFYRRHPEVHWALLAHMVSRNGGWNMTDLQGGLIPSLLDEEQRRETFRFLERANAFIFGDAYPQLLLYEEGKRAGNDLSYLLPALQVSRFMTPVWRVFWRERDSALLTVALIVNEQHYIESRVVRYPEIRHKVLEAPFFKLQSMLQLNQVVFPYSLHSSEQMKLAGLILEDFRDLQERIEFGKRLYAMLFRIPEIYGGVIRFARTVRHTGSRADYAPQLFTKEQNGKESGGALIFSPELSDAWADQPPVQPEEGDWFRSITDVERYFDGLPLPPSFEMTNEYEFGLHKIEAAALAADRLDLHMDR